MRKSLIVLVAVALLGALMLYAARLSENTAQSTAAGLSAGITLKDGTYAGDSAETPYGPVEVSIIIKNGKITDIKFLDMPNDDARSTEITGFASPVLKQNTLNAQSANIDFVSGATTTSFGYQESLQAALDRAAEAAVNFQNIQSS